MSDTPRTDVLLIAHDMAPTHISLISHARELERELNAANDRIKRLEDAGDALYENSDPTKWDLPEANARKLKEQQAWLKAKEDKP